MPTVESVINVAAFDQLEGKKCCICDKFFIEDESEILKQKRLMAHNFRVVFPRGCDNNHFLHTDCYYDKVSRGNLEDDCFCPKALCERRVGVKMQISEILEKCFDIVDACDPVIRMLTDLKEDRLEYEKLSELEGIVEELSDVIDRHHDAKELYINASIIIANSYLFHHPEAEGDVITAINTYQQVNDSTADKCREALEKAGYTLLEMGLNGSVQDLEYCFKRLAAIHGVCGAGTKVAECLAGLHLRRAQIDLDAVGESALRFACVEKARKFYTQSGLRSFTEQLEGACLKKCHLLIEHAREVPVGNAIVCFSMIEKIHACYPMSDGIRHCAESSVAPYLEIIEHCLQDKKFIDSEILNRIFDGLVFCKKYAGKKSHNRIDTLTKLYMPFMQGKFDFVLKVIRELLAKPSPDLQQLKGLSFWFTMIEGQGNSQQVRTLSSLKIKCSRHLKS